MPWHYFNKVYVRRKHCKFKLGWHGFVILKFTVNIQNAIAMFKFSSVSENVIWKFRSTHKTKFISTVWSKTYGTCECVNPSGFVKPGSKIKSGEVCTTFWTDIGICSRGNGGDAANIWLLIWRGLLIHAGLGRNHIFIKLNTVLTISKPIEIDCRDIQLWRGCFQRVASVYIRV